MADLRKELEHVINCASAENESNTPDFILAQYLQSCLDAFNAAVRERDRWYGIAPEPERRDQPPACGIDYDKGIITVNRAAFPAESIGVTVNGVFYPWDEETEGAPDAD